MEVTINREDLLENSVMSEHSVQHSINSRSFTRTISNPYVKIIEQPAPKERRFRYKREGTSIGSIPGACSTRSKKSFPTIQIVGFNGPARVIVSCVTKDAPYRPHPHRLVDKEGCCKKGIYENQIPIDTMSLTFTNLGIQCTKREDVETSLIEREEIGIDPFKTGFSHRKNAASLDLNAVRLCFHVFITIPKHTNGSEKKTVNFPLKPVVSEIIYDKKAVYDLLIVDRSDCVCPADGGDKNMIILCEKVRREDIQIRFFEEIDGQIVWEDYGHFAPNQVHRQTAISFRPPKYKDLDIDVPVRVYMHLRKPSDGANSEPLPFEYLPLKSDKSKCHKRITEISKKNLLPVPVFEANEMVALQETIRHDEPFQKSKIPKLSHPEPSNLLSIYQDFSTFNTSEINKANSILPVNWNVASTSNTIGQNEWLEQQQNMLFSTTSNTSMNIETLPDFSRICQSNSFAALSNTPNNNDAFEIVTTNCNDVNMESNNMSGNWTPLASGVFENMFNFQY